MSIEITHRTLTEIIIGGGLAQLTVEDPRRRNLIPVGHGGHRPVDLREVQSIGVDVSSLLLAQALEILDPVLERFHLRLPWSVYSYLYSEGQRIAYENRAQSAAPDLESLLQTLNRAQRSGRASILPYRLDDDEADVHALPLKELTADVRNMQAAWIDDRFLSELPTVTDSSGCERPLANLVDVILELQRSEKLSAQEAVEALLALRRRGYYVFPISEQELSASLRAATTIGPEGDLAETPDLVTLRQYVSRLRAGGFLKLPAENLFLDGLREICHRTLLSIWQDPQQPDTLVKAHSNWIFRNLYPASADWRHVLALPESIDWNDTVAREFAALIAISSAAVTRLDTFRAWLAETLAQREVDSPGLTRALATYLAPKVEAILSAGLPSE